MIETMKQNIFYKSHHSPTPTPPPLQYLGRSVSIFPCMSIFREQPSDAHMPDRSIIQ